MKQSKLLAEEEAGQQSAPMPVLGADVNKFIQLEDGVYKVYPVQCFGDYVAIAPFRRSEVTEGGIVVPQANELPNTGIIVGLGENVGRIKLGQHVKFIPKHKAADLTGEYEDYGEAEIAVYKAASVIAVLPQVEARMIRSPRAIVRPLKEAGQLYNECQEHA